MGGKKIETSSPIEIQFYTDYFIIYREKKYYDKKTSRMEYNKFFYSDITQIRYDRFLRKLNFSGAIDAMWFDYNKDGTVPQEPTYHRLVEGGGCRIYVFGDDGECIVEQLEKYTGVKVEMLN